MNNRKSLCSLTPSFSVSCRICGDVARGVNFNLATCLPCKSFFRRNALKRSSACCEFRNDCPITKETRSYCSPCRLKKCLAFGMNPQSFRRVSQSDFVSNKIQTSETIDSKSIQLPMPLPLSLLRNDRSTLTIGDWTLLSNCLHAFDEQNPSRRIQCSLNRLSSLPPKLRSKPSEYATVMREFFASTGPLIESSPDFYSLSTNARRTFMKNNFYMTSAINAMLLGRELGILNNLDISTSCNQLYGAEYMEKGIQRVARWEKNGSLIKIFIFILAFSSSCALVTYNGLEDIPTISSSIDLTRIQNVYVTMLWKYLVYLYGFDAATLRFTYLVTHFLDVMSTLDSMPKTETHDNVIDTIVIETERVLVIDH